MTAEWKELQRMNRIIQQQREVIVDLLNELEIPRPDTSENLRVI